MGSNPKTILMVIRQGMIGGGESHVLSVVSLLNKEKFRPVVLSFTPGEMVEALDKQGVPVYVISTTTPFNPKLTSQINAILQKEKVDLIHAHGTRAASNIYRNAKRNAIPLIYTVHGWSFHPGLHPVMQFLRRAAERFLTKKADTTICVSHANEVEGKQLLGLKNSVVIANGVNLNKFDIEANYPDIREELGIEKDKFLVGYIVRMTKQKNPLVLLQGIKIALEQKKNIHFLLVGTGDLKPQMLEYIRENKLEESLTFLDFRTDVPAILAAIDLYVLPSLWEGLPIGVMEAMAMGKACLVSNIATNEELITEGVNGLTVSNQSAEAIAERIVYAAENRQEMEKLGKAALQTVKEKYLLQPMVNKLEKLYATHLS